MVIIAASCVAQPIPSSLPANGNVATEQWEQRAAMPTARTHTGRAVVGSHVYVVGGLPSQAAALATVERFDPSSDRWESLAALPLAVDHPMAAGTQAAVVVTGGSYPSGTTRTFSYVVPGGPWREVAPLPEPLAAGGAAALGEEIFVIGGITSGAPDGRPSAYAYNVRSDAWRRLPAMPTARHHHAVVAYQGQVCALGGRGQRAAQRFECYDPRSDSWVTRAELPTAMEDFDVAAVGTELWAFPQHSATAYVFDGSGWTPRLGPAGIQFGHAAGYVAPWIVVVTSSSVWTLRRR